MDWQPRSSAGQVQLSTSCDGDCVEIYLQSLEWIKYEMLEMYVEPIDRIDESKTNDEMDKGLKPPTSLASPWLRHPSVRSHNCVKPSW